MSKMRVLLTVCLVAVMGPIGAAVPYSVDSHTLHLYHFDGDTIDSVTTNPIDLILDSGATVTDAKLPGLGQALYTYEGTSTAGTNLPSAMAPADTAISNFVGADGAFTFEALVCPAFDLGSLPNHMQIISGDHDAARGWHFRVDSAGNLVFTKLTGTIQDNMRTPVPSSGPHAFAADKWFHVAVTYNGQANTEGNLKLYWTALDSGASEAVLLGSFNLTADLDPGVAPSFVIGNEGRSGNGRTENWEGWIDEVRISDIARSASDMIPRVVLPTSASAPVPADGAVDVPRDQVLAWKAGIFAATHDVYLGTTLDDVANASTTDPLGVLVGEGLETATYVPAGPLALGRTYYWRVDEVNAPSNPGLYEGEVWSFEVEPVAYPVENVTVTASTTSAAGSGPVRCIDKSGLNADGQHSIVEADMWVGAAAAGEPGWIRFDFDRLYKLQDVRIWNYNHQYESFLGMGLKDVTIEYLGADGQWATLGDFEVPRAPGLATYAGSSIDFGGVGAQAVRINIHSNRSALQPSTYGLSEIEFNYIPVHAREPEPVDGATGVSIDATLSWRAGREAVMHQVHLGTDANAVADGTSLADAVGVPMYDPATLDLATTYYWRIDEVNEAATPSLWQSNLWSFSTREFFAVDDFEEYTDDEGNLIYEAWRDGFGIPSNGSQVGHDNPPYAEQAIVHSGTQSMPFAYGQENATVSEATLTLPAQDWTRGGAQTLVVYFRGTLGNAAGQVYLKINGTRVDYPGSTAALAAPLWTQWNVDLAALGNAAGNVTSLTFGVAASGTGLLYVDDIRLYRLAPPMPEPAVDPGADGLAASYQMEGNVSDDSGNGRDGTAETGASFAAGLAGYGQALVLDGTSGHASLQIGTLIASLDSMTVATWVNYSGTGAAWARVFDFGTGTNVYTFLAQRNGGNAMEFAITTGGGGGESQVTAPSALPTDWHHVAAVIDGAAGQLLLYLDGAHVGTGATATLPSALGDTTQNWIGRSQYTADPYFGGSVDDFRIYSRALSEAEIRYLVGDR